MTVPATLVALIVSVLIPAVTALTTKATASAWIKQLVTAGLAAVTGLLVAGATVDGGARVTQSAALLALGTFIAAQASYHGLYKPHGINAVLAPGVGLGSSNPPVA